VAEAVAAEAEAEAVAVAVAVAGEAVHATTAKQKGFGHR
jgi:hypothetical protein